MSEAITREEKLLNAIATGETPDIIPITRKEKYLRYLAGVGEKPAKPITREEMFLDKIRAGGTGGGGNSSDSQLDAMIDRSITEVSSNVTSIGEYAFYSCKVLTTANLPNVTTIGQYAFQNSSNLTEADFPNATSIGGSTFYGCSSLKTANLPLVTTISGSGIFYNCKALTTVNLPLITTMGSQFFQNCSSLLTVDLHCLTSVSNNGFYGCSSLKSLILRNTNIATLSNSNAFTNSAIANGTGYIYVPKALLSDTDSTKDYRRATNWSKYSTQFRILEEWTVDGTIYGQMDWDKINAAA